MTVTEAADKYGTDAAGIWAWIASGRARAVQTESGIVMVRLLADDREPSGRWIITDEVVSQ